MKAITKATLKSFIRKNSQNLYVMVTCMFDGQTDGIKPVTNPQFEKVKFNENQLSTFGIGIYLCGTNAFYPYNENGFAGIQIVNSLGIQIVATR